MCISNCDKIVKEALRLLGGRGRRNFSHGVTIIRTKARENNMLIKNREIQRMFNPKLGSRKLPSNTPFILQTIYKCFCDKSKTKCTQSKKVKDMIATYIKNLGAKDQAAFGNQISDGLSRAQKTTKYQIISKDYRNKVDSVKEPVEKFIQGKA